MAKSKDPSNLQQAKIEVRKAIGKVAKDAVQGYRNYKYVSHEGVTAAVIPAMHEAGMTHTPSCESIEVHDGVAFVHIKVLFQMAKEWCDTEDLNAEATYVYAADKIKDGTSMGAIISYGVKTALIKYFGLESGDPDLEELQTDKEEAPAPISKGEMKTSAEDTLEIFNGKEMPTAEDAKTFIDICKEVGVTSDQLDQRIAEEGYKTLEDIPKTVLTDWTERMRATLNG